MFRVKFSRLGPFRGNCSRLLALELPQRTASARVQLDVPNRFLSSKGDGKQQVTSHPQPQACSQDNPSHVKLKKCDPIDIDPTRFSPDPMRIPSIKECKTPNLMDGIPQPNCGWSEGDSKFRKKGKRVLLAGVLFAAATLGAVLYSGIFKLEKEGKHKKVVTSKKKKKEEETTGTVKIPPSSSEIPKEVPYLLIGGGTAAFSAFRAIKSADPTAKVLVISDEPYFSYMRPPLSKEMWFNEDKDSVKKMIFKQWNGSERSLFYEPEDFYIECRDLLSTSNGGVAVARGWKITRIDVVGKLAYLDDGSAIHYDKCLLATGATPRLSPIFEVAAADQTIGKKIKLYRNIDDFNEVYDEFETAKSVAIIGGGFLGSELACALGRKDKKKSKDIYQIFREGGNMGKILPEYLSLWTTDKVKAEGVQVLTNSEVVGVKHDPKGGLLLQLNTGKKITADFVIVAVGVEPNTELAKESDLEVDPELGGFLVNTELQARTDLYIAGDCACFYDPRLGRRRLEHHDHAVVTGRLAGENMTGARRPYLHQSMFWSDLGPEVGYEAVGVVDSSLPTVGVFAKQTPVDTPKAIVSMTDEGDRSKTEEIPQSCEKFMTDEEKQRHAEELERQRQERADRGEAEHYGKGVVFYLRNDIVVGVVLWNVFNRMSVARQVLKEQKKYDDLNEVAKLFNIHDD